MIVLVNGLIFLVVGGLVLANGVTTNYFGTPGAEEHALPVELEPLPADATASYLEARFHRTDRDVGNALDPLLAFTRGHPQRTMLVAHHLWELVPPGSVADESAFVEARSRTLAQTEPALRARWESLAVNEQRVSVALATRAGGLYAEETQTEVSQLRTFAEAKLLLRNRGLVVGVGGAEFRVSIVRA